MCAVVLRCRRHSRFGRAAPAAKAWMPRPRTPGYVVAASTSNARRFSRLWGRRGAVGALDAEVERLLRKEGQTGGVNEAAVVDEAGGVRPGRGESRQAGRRRRGWRGLVGGG